MAKLIPLRGKNCVDKFAIVDDEDYEDLMKYKWRMRKDGYAITTFDYHTISMHRLILQLSRHDKFTVDHKNNNRLDNQRHNIRLCSRSGNSFNKSKQKTSALSKFKGTSWCERDKAWRCYIKKNYIYKCLGYFQSEIDSAEHYDWWAIQLFGPFANLNFPEKDYSNFQISNQRGVKIEPDWFYNPENLPQQAKIKYIVRSNS